MWSCFEASWTRAWWCSEKNVLNFGTSASGVGALMGAAFLVRMESGDQFFATICDGHILRSVEAKHVSEWPPQLGKAHRTFQLSKLVNPYWNVNKPENLKWSLGIGCRLQETYLCSTKFNNKYQNDLHLPSLGWHWYIFKGLYISLRHIYFWTFINDHPVCTLNIPTNRPHSKL